MANAEELAKLQDLLWKEWNEWRASQSEALDLGGADLRGKDLVGKDLRDANLKHSDLRGVMMGDADLRHADLSGADLRGSRLDKANLSGASLRETNLQGVDLSVAQRGLQTEQLAGADLTGATLPPELSKLYDSLENVNNISESARKLFLAVLAACLYSWLTIATTTDVNLITNRASSPLPIIQTSIPIVGFYWVAPLLLLCVYFYFHFYLQKLWEELGSLPAILPDGRPLHAKIDPWLLNDLVRAHLPKLNINRPFMSYFQLWISVLLAWWVVPMTMFLFWGRFLPRHERTGTTFHVVLLMISLTAALSLYRLAVATLRAGERKAFMWKGMLTSRRGYQSAAFALAVGVLFGVISWGAIMGTPSDAPILGIPLLLQRNDPFLSENERMATGRLTWAPRLMALIGYSPFANLTGAEVSQKKTAWNKNDYDPDSVAVAQLQGANLRYSRANWTFLSGAILYKADLTGANLEDADLRGADLIAADLRDADLEFADLRNADLSGARLVQALLNPADLSGARLDNADLTGAYMGGATLRGARLLEASLRGVDLGYGADLRDVLLRRADLSGADLQGASLSGAVLDGANLQDTNLSGAELAYTDLKGARNVNLETVKGALHWDKAFYDENMLKALGLPPDHNDKLAAQQKAEQKKEKELQQKQNVGPPASNPPVPTQN